MVAGGVSVAPVALLHPINDGMSAMSILASVVEVVVTASPLLLSLAPRTTSRRHRVGFPRSTVQASATGVVSSRASDTGYSGRPL
jgi:hypothetical protein